VPWSAAPGHASTGAEPPVERSVGWTSCPPTPGSSASAPASPSEAIRDELPD